MAPHPGDATAENVSVRLASGQADVLRLTVNVPADPLWSIQSQRGIPADVPTGHVVRLHFLARSETGNPVRVTVEESRPPYPVGRRGRTRPDTGMERIHGGGDHARLRAGWLERAFSGRTKGGHRRNRQRDRH